MPIKQPYLRPTATHWQTQAKRPSALSPDVPELLETTHRPIDCRWCLKHPDGHPSRIWEVWTVPNGELRARVPECVLLQLLRKRRNTRKMSDPEKAILSELHRLGVIQTQECPK